MGGYCTLEVDPTGPCLKMQPSSAKPHGSSVDSWLTGSHSSTNKTMALRWYVALFFVAATAAKFDLILYGAAAQQESIHQMPMCQSRTKKHILSGLWVLSFTGFCWHNMWTFVKLWNFSTCALYDSVQKSRSSSMPQWFQVSISELNRAYDGSLNLTMKNMCSFKGFLSIKTLQLYSWLHQILELAEFWNRWWSPVRNSSFLIVFVKLGFVEGTPVLEAETSNRFWMVSTSKNWIHIHPP